MLEGDLKDDVKLADATILHPPRMMYRGNGPLFSREGDHEAA